MVFGTFPTVGSEPQKNQSDTLKVVKDFLKAVCVVVFVPHSLCMSQYNNEDTNKKDVWLFCLLPVAPVNKPPSDSNIYRYLPWAFKRVYAITCTATFWQRKIVTMTYGVSHIHQCLLSVIAVCFKVAPFLSLFNVSSISAISGSTTGTECFGMVCRMVRWATIIMFQQPKTAAVTVWCDQCTITVNQPILVLPSFQMFPADLLLRSCISFD
jgi:hypothetical protein